MSARGDALRDEIELLTRSLDDAGAEHARGELDDAALAAIVRRDGVRLAAARDALGELGDDAAPDPPRASSPLGPRRRPRVLLGVAAACLAIAIAIVALAVARPFASEPPAGSATTQGKVHALLLVAEVLVGSDHPLRALTSFDAVLSLAPTNPEALVESGWLRYEDLGLGEHRPAQLALGAAELRRAARLAPRDAAAHLYFAIVLLQHDHDRAAARAQVRLASALPESVDERALTFSLLATLG